MLTKEVVSKAISLHNVPQAAIDYALKNQFPSIQTSLDEDIGDLTRSDLWDVWTSVSSRIVAWCDYNDPDSVYRCQFYQYANSPWKYTPPFHLLKGE